MGLSEDRMYERLLASDSAYDGRFYAGVLTTGIYCLPSCKARKPKRENVRFFTSEHEAVEFGLRACRKCRPDSFGLYLEEQRVEEAVNLLRLAPGQFRGVEDLAAELKVGQSKLNELTRRYYHATPAFLIARAKIESACQALLKTETSIGEVALDCGFESLSAFYDNFRKLTGLAPQEYRALRCSECFELALPEGFDAERWSRHLRRDAQSLSERWLGDRWAFAALLEDTPARLEVGLNSGRAICRIDQPGLAASAHRWLAHRLGMTQDLRGFEALAAQDDVAARLMPNGRALRVPQTGGVWEGLVWAILGQQVNIAFAATLKRRLTELAGEPVGEALACLPGPARVAALTPDQLTGLQCSRAKAEVLVDLAGKATAGDLPLDGLPDWPATKVERTLLGLKGIGPWSANYLMMRSCGFLDCVPLGDTGLTSALQRHFDLAARPGREETTRLMSRFAPYRSLATYHLWNSLSEDV